MGFRQDGVPDQHPRAGRLEGSIGNWQVINDGTGAVLASGSRAGVITFASTSLTKITFRITSASATPKVAEFETYAS